MIELPYAEGFGNLKNDCSSKNVAVGKRLFHQTRMNIMPKSSEFDMGANSIVVHFPLANDASSTADEIRLITQLLLYFCLCRFLFHLVRLEPPNVPLPISETFQQRLFVDSQLVLVYLFIRSAPAIRI
ncbi:Uncharacterized protein APZ42_025154 [Daphnia magna]|uniref:Uncharacterized protein n=1 Tax=Daphnia magna TaxID=35525 RepID=A0A164TE49_9CRUS|nr:Uncharacterized protein APZ42_025154 [Daphnia magna]